jgi:hypothetical protein
MKKLLLASASFVLIAGTSVLAADLTEPHRSEGDLATKLKASIR